MRGAFRCRAGLARGLNRNPSGLPYCQPIVGGERFSTSKRATAIDEKTADKLMKAREAAKVAKVTAREATKRAKDADRLAKNALKDAEKAAAEADRLAQIVSDLNLSKRKKSSKKDTEAESVNPLETAPRQEIETMTGMSEQDAIDFSGHMDDFISEHKGLHKEDTDKEIPAIIRAALQGAVGELKALIANGEDVNVAESEGWTALMGASSEGYAECVRLLLSAGAVVDQTDLSGGTALMLAALDGHVACIEILLAAGASVDKMDENKYTALNHSLFEGHLSCVRALVEAGADMYHVDSGGLSIMAHASNGEHTEVINYLDDKMAEYSLIR